MSQTNLAFADKLYTVEEYLAFERAAEEKHEYIDGRIIAVESEFETTGMAGATRKHNLVSGNVFGELRNQLKGRDCEIYINDMRVRMKKNRYGYPDVVIVCGEPEFADAEFDTLNNPTVVVEVLSKSTRFRDKTEKLEIYQKMESVQECVLIEQDRMLVQLYKKQTPKQWLVQIADSSEDAVEFESIGCRLLLSDIYAQVKFDPQTNEPEI